jgi:FAD synthetase
MRRVMVFGSFDPLHEGHRSLFRQARRHGDELIVVVATDINLKRFKGHDSSMDERTRAELVRREPLVDDAVLGDERDFLKVIVRLQPDVIILGYDQTTYDDEELRRLLAERGVRPAIMRAVAFQPERYKSRRINGLSRE